MIEFRSVLPMKTAKTGYIIISVILSLLGLGLIIFPSSFLNIIGKITGIILTVFGIVKLIGYFSKDLYRLAFQFDLAFGILLILLGLVITFKTKNIINFICIVLGILTLTDGLFKVQISLDARQFGIKLWWLILSFALLTGIFGALLIIRPGKSAELMTVLIGISLLVEGILSLSTVLTAVKIIKYQKPENFDIKD